MARRRTYGQDHTAPRPSEDDVTERAIDQAADHQQVPRRRVLALSTTAFTLMFA